jgi:hypothetical protein
MPEPVNTPNTVDIDNSYKTAAAVTMCRDSPEIPKKIMRENQFIFRMQATLL